MNLIKKIHYYLVYISLRLKGIDKSFSRTIAEQYTFFKYDKKKKK